MFLKYLLLAVVFSLAGISAVVMVRAETVLQLASALVPAAAALLVILIADLEF